VTALRILIADDHEVVRQGIRTILEAEPGWTVCAEAATGWEAVSRTLEIRPDVVVMDLAMPDLNGLDATRRILKERPDMAILVLTMHNAPGIVRELLQAGVLGYVLKSDAGRSLVEAVRQLSKRRPFITPKVTGVVIDEFRQPSHTQQRSGRGPLTPREREVLQLLCEGRTNKEVAATLGISVKTADTHRTRIMRKLDVHSAVELVRYAIRAGIARP